MKKAKLSLPKVYEVSKHNTVFWKTKPKFSFVTQGSKLNVQKLPELYTAMKKIFNVDLGQRGGKRNWKWLSEGKSREFKGNFEVIKDLVTRRKVMEM